MKIQICVSSHSDETNKIAIQKMKELKEKLDAEYGDDYTVHSCLLPKKILEEKGFDPTIVNAVENIFGDKYICELKINSFKEVKQKLDHYRKVTAQKVDKLIILSTEKVNGVAIELQYFTENKVIVI